MENLTLSWKRSRFFTLIITPYIILISENSFKLGIVIFVMLNEMLVKVLLSTFTLDIGWDPKTQSFNLCPFLTLSVRNGPSVSFETNVPWNVKIFNFFQLLNQIQNFIHWYLPIVSMEPGFKISGIQ